MPSRRPAALLLGFLGASCAGEASSPVAAADPSVSDVRVVVPSPGLPPEVSPDAANNNLDIVRHDGRLYLAFRTAPSHFAGTETRLHVVSTTDEEAWTWEATFERGTDLREPRLLSWNGQLFLYFAVLGTNALAFEPQGMMVSRREGPGQWSEAEWFHEPGFIPWRTKVVNGVPYMVAYTGGENLYEPGRAPEPVEVHWLTTKDGVAWGPVVPGQPVVTTGGGSETDFVLLDDGAVLAVSRNELGDALGWGSKICRAEASSPGDWTCVGDPRKYDSPLLFRHGGGIWLLGRRNVTADGRYDLGRTDVPPEERTVTYQIDYSTKPKRCALWRVDPETLGVTHVLDLPSRGDTCFPGLVHQDDGTLLVYNYTSPLDGEDVTWIEGQTGPTHVVRQVLTIP